MADPKELIIFKISQFTGIHPQNATMATGAFITLKEKNTRAFITLKEKKQSSQKHILYRGTL